MPPLLIAAVLVVDLSVLALRITHGEWSREAKLLLLCSHLFLWADVLRQSTGICN